MTRVAGETIQGRVELNLISAQEDKLERLRIKFRGTIHTYVSHDYSYFIYFIFLRKITTTGAKNVDHSQIVTLFHEEVVLWTRESASLDSDHHTSMFAFGFKLPENLPSSFHCWWIYRHATIRYSLEVVGERNGFHRWNRRIRKLISVVPGASEEHLLAKESLRQGWSGPWQDFVNEEKLRQGIWGHYSHARVRLTIPNMSSYPIATPIPFRFHVKTDTKPMRVGILAEDVEDIFSLKGSLGDATRVAAIHHVIEEPQWILAPESKDENGRGIWRRAAHFESAVAIPYAPTCSTETLDWEYHLRFVVPFPGIGNDLLLDFPIQLHPVSACPPPPFSATGLLNLTYTDILPAELPPPMVDLPPAYWASTHHSWDVDVKS
ncbi:hypothetical protein B0H16DRAFT_1705252 [Mycena metata]|uniref:Arrestin-like N-terminal domain-containing protein n=1 Tax=Mycena metata TaxID=1033252 RepID=A0AAD7E010_9AGAR|nr:hypothetical protein B0H16DRAFT_1705252 [Mycena metata]